MNLKELYQEIVLDHGKNPRNKKRCKGFNKQAEGHNPLCGDKVHVFLKLNKENELDKVSVVEEGSTEKNISEEEINVNFRICPSCNQKGLKTENGCDVCIVCGYSKCDK